MALRVLLLLTPFFYFGEKGEILLMAKQLNVNLNFSANTE
jgi:hypothetical protein